MTFNVGQRILHKIGIIDASQVVVASIAQHAAHTSCRVAVIDGRPGGQFVSADRAFPTLRFKHRGGIFHGHTVIGSEMVDFRGHRSAPGRLFATATALLTSRRQSVQFVSRYGKITTRLDRFACWASLLSGNFLREQSYFVGSFSSSVQLTLVAPCCDSKPVSGVCDEFAKIFGYFTARASFHGVEV